MLKHNDLNAKEALFVEKYLEYGDPYGVQAAKEAEKGRSHMEAYFLTRPTVVARIRANNGPEPIVVVKPLDTKEHKFLDVYLETLDLKVTAERCDMLYRVAREWMKRPHFKHELTNRLNEIRHNSIIKGEEVIEELATIAFADITDFCSFDNQSITIKNSADIANSSALSEVSQGQHGIKIKMHNKMNALESLAKYLGLFKERIELTGKDGAPIQIESPLDSLNDKLNKIGKNNSNRDALDKTLNK